jgi:tetratricopeptide (TPR) repeat protein
MRAAVHVVKVSMPVSAWLSRLLLPVALLGTVLLAGCGGAEGRKARHLEKGEAFLAQKNFENARTEFRSALQIAPNDSVTRYENGVADERLGNRREAAQFYQGAIDSNSDNILARAALGRMFLFAGAPERALETVKPSIAKHPVDASLLTVRAAARLQLKDPDGALTDAERAVQLAPSSEDAAAVLAEIYRARNEPDKARVLLENSIKQIPGTVDLRLALAQVYASLGQDQIPKVEAVLVDLVRQNPNERSHRIRLAQFYTRLNHPDDAERVLREGIRAVPDDRQIKISLIQFLAARRSRDAAAKELSGMIAADPKDYDLRLAQAQFYEQGKEYPQAIAAYRDIISAAKLDPPGISARDRLAALKLQQGDPQGAQQLLAEVLAKSPRDSDALMLRGALELEQKDPKSAIADLGSVLRDRPNAIYAMRTLARAHLANGEPALAEDTMRRAVDADPKDASARLDFVQLLVQLGKPDQAKPVIEELIKQQPDNEAALQTQFKVAAATGDQAEAQSAADALVATHPKEALGYLEQGVLAEKQQHLEEALRLYSKALDLQPEAAEPLEAIAGVLVKLNRLPEALKRLDAVAAQYPTVPIALNAKGSVLLSAQRPADAEVAFKAAIDRQPRWWVPYRGLAVAQVQSHDNDAAIATLKSAIDKVQPPQPAQTELAGLFERLGKPDDAILVYESALRNDPQAEVAANNLAMLLVSYRKDQPSLDRAKALAARFANSTNPAYLDTYGWVLYKRGESAAAITALQNALAKEPDSPVSLYHLGMAQMSTGQHEAARLSLARSLQLGKNFPGMDEAKVTLDKLAAAGTPTPVPRKT